MELSYTSVQGVLEHCLGDLGEWDYGNEYGEPGYEFRSDATTPIVVLGDYWCRCDKIEGLHSYDQHHPRVWAQLERQGVELEWYDEWTVDHEDGAKVYRTQPDSYSWQPSFVYTDDGDMITPASDIEDWIEWATDDPVARCIPSRSGYDGAALVRAGFVEYDQDYRSGWYGREDDPKKIVDEIHKWHGPSVDIVFVLDSTGQFEVSFSAYYRGEDDSSYLCPAEDCDGTVRRLEDATH